MRLGPPLHLGLNWCHWQWHWILISTLPSLFPRSLSHAFPPSCLWRVSEAELDSRVLGGTPVLQEGWPLWDHHGLVSGGEGQARRLIGDLILSDSAARQGLRPPRTAMGLIMKCFRPRICLSIWIQWSLRMFFIKKNVGRQFCSMYGLICIVHALVVWGEIYFFLALWPPCDK